MGVGDSKVWVILPAAGMGLRMGGDRPKQYLSLAGQSILKHSLGRFSQFSWVAGIVLVLPRDDLARFREIPHQYPKVISVEGGGETRSKSVRRGVAALNASQSDFVMIHDAVRPLVSERLCLAVLEAAWQSGAAIAALPVKGTVKRAVRGKMQIEETVDRRMLWEAQTPQVFSYSLLERGYEQCQGESSCADLTDEAMLIERLGISVVLVEGEERNLKITRPLDLKIAEALLNEENHKN